MPRVKKTAKVEKTEKKVKVKVKAKAETKENVEKEIETLLTDLLTRLTVKATLLVTKDAEDQYKVVIQSEETGLLIGRHGETINSLQLLLGVILYKKLGRWVRVVLDIGDYRKMREDTIKQMVDRIVIEVETGGQPVILPFLTPLERRFVHMMFQDHKTLMSESSGEGRERRVVVKLRA